MKWRHLLSAFCACFCFGLLAEEPLPPLTAAMRAFEKAFNEKDVSRMVSVLASVDTNKDLRFGGGLGPDDKSSMQILFLQMFERIPNLDNALNSLEATGDATRDAWRKRLQTCSDDMAALAEMLKSQEPSVRYCALQKIRRQPFSKDMADRLLNMVRSDPYIVIQKVSPKPKGNAPPPPPGSADSAFVSPTRRLAKDILTGWKVEAAIDERKLAEEGVVMLMELYRQGDKDRKFQILCAVGMFSPDTTAQAAVKELDPQAIAAENRPVLAIFRELVDKKKKPWDYTDL